MTLIKINEFPLRIIRNVSIFFQMACQSKDLDSLSCLQVELWPMLSAEQQNLLHLVIEELNHPLGEGV